MATPTEYFYMKNTIFHMFFLFASCNLIFSCMRAKEKNVELERGCDEQRPKKKLENWSCTGIRKDRHKKQSGEFVYETIIIQKIILFMCLFLKLFTWYEIMWKIRW